MPLSEKLILEFQDIYEMKTGTRLSFDDASKYAEDIVEVFDVLAQIDFREKRRKGLM